MTLLVLRWPTDFYAIQKYGAKHFSMYNQRENKLNPACRKWIAFRTIDDQGSKTDGLMWFFTIFCTRIVFGPQQLLWTLIYIQFLKAIASTDSNRPRFTRFTEIQNSNIVFRAETKFCPISGERQCKEGEFKCNNGQCFDLVNVCVNGYSFASFGCRDDTNTSLACRKLFTYHWTNLTVFYSNDFWNRLKRSVFAFRFVLCTLLEKLIWCLVVVNQILLVQQQHTLNLGQQF